MTEQNSELWSIKIADKILPYKWDNKKPTAQMLGRWQPWSRAINIQEIIQKTGQVNIHERCTGCWR